jgi:predicted DsbA family dithiol-disulfide isomerase
MTTSKDANAGKLVRIDIVSDVVCPWCIVGYKQLERAQAETAVPAVVLWHPFELNPHMPEGGEDLYEHVAAKYGSTPEASRRARAQLTAIGTQLGFTFDYADDMRMVNTFRAHQLLHWAASLGRQHALKMALFSAYFSHRKNVNDAAVLSEVAASVGLDAEETAAVIADGRFAGDVRQHEAFWTSRGVQGVPAMIFDGREALIGAQGVDRYRAMLLRLSGAMEREDG